MKKKLVSMMLLVTSITYLNPMSIKAEQQYGITYNDKKYDAVFKTGMSMSTRDENGKIIGKMSYTVGRLRYKKKNSNGTYQDVLVVRMLMEPQKEVASGRTVRWGVSEYLKMSAALPTDSVNKWEPANVPKSSTWNIGISTSTQDPLAVAASTTVVKKQLELEADVRPSKKLANMIYDYRPNKSRSWDSDENKYVRNSSIQYAMVSYNPKKYSSMKFTFNANFTWALDKYATPVYVASGSDKGKVEYTWKF